MRSLCLTLNILWAAHCSATGLINRLPEDGTWAHYKMNMEKEYRGAVMNFTGDFHIASVGRQEEGDGPRRWLEFKMINKSREKETMILKTLLPEDGIDRGLSTWDYAVKGWVRELKREPYPMDPNKLIPVLRFFLNGDNPQETKATVSTAPSLSKRNIELERVTGTMAYQATFDHKKVPTQVSIRIDYECWLDRDSPFGTREAVFTLVVRDATDRLKERVKTTLTLIESGQGAVSDLPAHH